ncbi:hypothetical protein ABVV53_10130 [Novosphingobium sp. RD2P27]|uniref:UrcA family protein n=1 Tax=Novosphingobium kalidii TaxID=3230299 RepID=A0ABV2D1Q2_9SPHN
MKRLLCAVLALTASLGTAQAQVDWSGMIGTIAQEDAVREAAREGSNGGQIQHPRNRQSAASASNAKARRQCASARGKASRGMRDPRLTQILSLCNRAGY